MSPGCRRRSSIWLASKELYVMKQRCERPLSATERIWLGFDGAFSPYANQAVLEGRGNLDFEHLKSAVETASTANPGSRLVLSGSLRGSFWRDSGVTPRVRKVRT